MCKEEDARKSINSISIIKPKEFDVTAGGILVRSRHKDLQSMKVLRKKMAQKLSMTKISQKTH